MAIVSISRIQHRRGIKVDIPANLFEGELGWCIDTRELYIGNGLTTGGNSQVLSQHSENDQLITHIYRGSSRIPATTGLPFPTVRSIGDIFDDRLSVKNYGAKGDGITDDTDAIQRAINDRWNTMDFSAIFFPAGTYNISNTIYIRPNVSLIGEGSTMTTIVMIPSGNNVLSVLTTADSKGQIQYNIGLSNATLPNNITIQGFTLDLTQIPTTLTGIKLQRSSSVNLSDLNIIGNWVTGTIPGGFDLNITGISIETLGTLNLADNIRISNFTANGLFNAIYCNDVSRYITIDGFNINNCLTGITFETNTVTGNNGPSFVRIMNGTFQTLDSYGLSVVSSNPGIFSTNNVYDTVGEVIGVPPIIFGSLTNNCSSINDSFSLASNFITLGNPESNIIVTPQKISMAVQQVTPIGPITLLNNSTNMATGVQWDSLSCDVIFLHYSIQRGTSKRAGKLTLLVHDSLVDIADDGLDSNIVLFGAVGVTWSAILVGSVVNLMYTTTDTGNNGNFWYTQFSWNM